MSFSSIKAVTFDAAHTIYHPHPSVGAIYREVMQQHGLDYAENQLEAGFRAAFRCVAKDKAILDGERREWSYWYAIVRESISHLAPQPADLGTLFEDLWQEFSRGDRWKPEPTARETLAKLQSRGYTTALLTNWDQRVRRVVAETNFDVLFDHLFISSEIGHEKPDRAIFTHCQASLKLAPHEILHIGDSLQHDIEGARAAGWRSLRLVSEIEADEHGETIEQLSQLLSLLR